MTDQSSTSDRLSDGELERAWATIGVPTPGRTTAWTDVADASSISHFAFGYGDDNPLWNDAEYGQASRWRTQIAPPMYLISVGRNETPPLGPDDRELFKGLFAGLGKYFAGVALEWFRPVAPGDQLFTERTTSSVELRVSSFSGGRSAIETYQTLYVNRFGEPVAVRRERYVNTERDGSKQTGKHRDLVRETWTPEAIAEIDAVYAAERPRGADHRMWEDVDIGDELPPLMKGPLTMVDIISMHMGMGWGGYGIGPLRLAHKMRTRMPGFYSEDPYGVPEVVQRLHWDEARAVELGLPAPYDYGQMRVCWLSHVATDWMGDDGWLATMDVDVRGFNFHGDAHICGGAVVDKRVDADRPVVDLHLFAMNQRHEVTCEGSATIGLPSREHGPVVFPRPEHGLLRRASEIADESSVRRRATDASKRSIG